MKYRLPFRIAALLPLLFLFPLLSIGAAEKTIKVVATTSMVADLVKNIGGNAVQVEGLMGPGVDPHLYKATARDALKLQQAQVIFYNGLLLEGKMEELFAQMRRKKKPVVAVTEALKANELLPLEETPGHFDPHVWFDVQLWSRCIDPVVKALSAVDPGRKAVYERNGTDYRARLESLHQWALQRAEEIPPDGRILVTSHDAFNYFGRAYGFDVVGLQGISTVTEAGLADMAKLVDFVRERKVRAIFVESSVAPNAIKRISQDTGVRIGGELFSDAMGTPGEMENGYDLGTYEGMFKHNLNTIVTALK